jgi:hypothetical protein
MHFQKTKLEHHPRRLFDNIHHQTCCFVQTIYRRLSELHLIFRLPACLATTIAHAGEYTRFDRLKAGEPKIDKQSTMEREV